MITFHPEFGEGLYWPDYDHSPLVCYRRVIRHLRDMDVTLKFVKGRQLCVQAGGHCGLWPARLASMFDVVHTFEPELACYKAMVENTKGHYNIVHYSTALGEVSRDVMMRPAVSAGGWRVDPEGSVSVPQVALDDLALPVCDVIFLDVEGYEAHALRGARQTIEKFRPVLHVEELPRHSAELRKTLADLRYKEVARIHGDRTFVYAA